MDVVVGRKPGLDRFSVGSRKQLDQPYLDQRFRESKGSINGTVALGGVVCGRITAGGVLWSMILWVVLNRSAAFMNARLVRRMSSVHLGSPKLMFSSSLVVYTVVKCKIRAMGCVDSYRPKDVLRRPG